MSAQGAGPPGGDETGRPLRLLLEQRQQPSADFSGRLRRRIHRRAAASQAIVFSWELPKIVLMEMSGILRELVAAVGGRKENER